MSTTGKKGYDENDKKDDAAKRVTVDQKIKYISDTDYSILLKFVVKGPVRKPDLIGSIYKHNSSVLPESTLESLQIKRRLGRFQISLQSDNASTHGQIRIPIRGDAIEASIIAGNLETIEKVGPFNASVKTQSIRSDRLHVKYKIFENAKAIYNTKIGTTVDSLADFRKELTRQNTALNYVELGNGVYGGPWYTQNELYIVEGLADVKHLAKHKVYNTVSVDGANFNTTHLDPLLMGKTLTVLTDADRGGNLLLKKIASCYPIDYVVQIPAGTSVENLAKEQIYEALYHNKKVYKHE